MRRHLVHIFWGILIFIVGFGTLFFVSVWNGWIGYMPEMEALSNPVDKFASQVYSADGKLIGTWNQDNANRVAIDYNALSPHLVHALVSTEDERFYEHSGIDFIALGRAIVKRGIMGHDNAGGGSTITQQLAKQVYSEKAHSTFERLLQKPIEWIIAVKLERFFTKEEIVAMYLNYFDFLHNAVESSVLPTFILAKNQRICRLPKRLRWWDCAKIRPCIIRCAMKTAVSIDETLC